MISTRGLNLLANFEGLRTKAYPDPATGDEPWTIGIGTTIYPSGIKVRKGDVCTVQQAYDYARWDIANIEDDIDRVLKVSLNQNQRDAVISFVYNLGIGNFSKSTLLKKINKNPNDPSIRAQFMVWNKAGGKVLRGLTLRREAEANYYFS